MKKIISTCVLIVSICLNFQAQYYEISLDEKMNKAKLVIEGEVIESESFRFDEKHIYTAHKIKVYKSFKTDPITDHISIITRGGKLDGAAQTWTHMLTLSKGQAGIFFLEKTPDPPNNLEKVTDEYYKVYSGVQGFLKYTEKTSGLTAHEIYNSYKNVPLELFDTFTKKYHKPYKTLASAKWDYSQKNDVSEAFTSSEEQDGRCLDFLFEIEAPNPSNPLLLSVVVSIKASENTHVTRPVIRANYNALSLGSNLASAGSITLEDIGLSANLNYQSIIEDIAPDKVEIRIGATSLAQPDLIEITTSYTTLIKMNIQLPGPIDPSIILDQETMTGLSKYFDFSDGLEKHFDCMRIDGDFNAFICPSPMIVGYGTNTLNSGLPHSTNLDNLVGGHDQYISIFGSCFGEPGPNSYVEFENSESGPGVDWVRARDGDYNVPFDLLPDVDPWTDQTIRVMIPSFGYGPNGKNFHAGTGKIRVVVDGVESIWGGGGIEDEIDIDYSLLNANEDAIAFPDHSVIVRPNNHNGLGGYDLWYGEGMDDNIEAQNAFETALCDWVTATNINFVIKDPSEIVDTDSQTEIYFTDLGDGTLSGSLTLAETPSTNAACYVDNNIAVGLKLDFDIHFNNNDVITWYYDEETTGINLGVFEADFQSVALHELGHAVGLNHSNNSGDLMFFNNPSDFNREITPDALAGGNFMKALAITPVLPIECTETYGGPMTLQVCDDTNSIEELDGNSSLISIYPNPSNDIIYINDELNRFNLYYEIRNVLGDIIINGNSNNGDGIRIGNIANGLYYISIKDKLNIIGTYKILKK